jgi:hypothetical protein
LLEYELCNHPDNNFVSYLCTGLRHGFDTLVQSEKFKNNLSARVQETVVSELIDKELQKGFIYGLFTHLPAVAGATPRLNVTDCDETGFPHSFCE